MRHTCPVPNLLKSSLWLDTTHQAHGRMLSYARTTCTCTVFTSARRKQLINSTQRTHLVGNGLEGADVGRGARGGLLRVVMVYTPSTRTSSVTFASLETTTVLCCMNVEFTCCMPSQPNCDDHRCLGPPTRDTLPPVP